MASDFAAATSGQEDDEFSVAWEVVPFEERITARALANQEGEWMTYIGCVHAAFAKPSFLEREKAEEFVNKTRDTFYAALTPGPDLGSNEIEDRDVAAFQLTGKPQMKIGTVRQECGCRKVAIGVAEELTIFAINAWQMSDDFGKADYRDTSGIDNRMNALGFQLGPSAAVKAGGRIGLAKIPNHSRGIKITGCLTRGNQKLHLFSSSLASCGSGTRVGRGLCGPSSRRSRSRRPLFSQAP